MHTKLILASIGGFGLGGFFAWAVTADYYDEKLKRSQELFQDILERQQAAYQTMAVEEPDFSDYQDIGTTSIMTDMLDDSPAQALEGILQEKSVAESIIEDIQQDLADEQTQETIEETRSNLQSIIDSYVSPEEHDPTAFTDMARVAVEIDENTAPFVISRQLFIFDEAVGDTYDKQTMTYYRNQRLLLDEDEELVSDIAGIVGWGAFSRFGDESDDPNVVYVRNHKRQCDYEVILEDEDDPPIHIRYGISKDEFEAKRLAGTIKLRDVDA